MIRLEDNATRVGKGRVSRQAVIFNTSCTTTLLHSAAGLYYRAVSKLKESIHTKDQDDNVQEADMDFYADAANSFPPSTGTRDSPRTGSRKMLRGIEKGWRKRS
jgi:hypothetical protein